MTSKTIRFATALASGALLVVGANTLTSTSQAAPGGSDVAVTDVSARAGGAATYRVRPFGGTIIDTVGEYYTAKVPSSGNYNVTLRGFINYDDAATTQSLQCIVGDKQKLLGGDFSGYNLVVFNDTDTGWDYGLNESIDVDLNKNRPILIACGSYGGDVDIIKPITVTFKRNGDFKNLPYKVFNPEFGFGELTGPLG